jgi:hypothetical protein
VFALFRWLRSFLKDADLIAAAADRLLLYVFAQKNRKKLDLRAQAQFLG